MARNPDPALELTTTKGVSRTLDDWSTMFHLCLIVLPERPEANAWVSVGLRIFDLFGGADCKAAFVVTGPPALASRILGDAEEKALCFVDPDRALVRSLGLEHLPAFVHLRQDTTLVAAAEGWDPNEWQAIARGIAKATAWSVPEVAPPGVHVPPPTAGWAA